MNDGTEMWNKIFIVAPTVLIILILFVNIIFGRTGYYVKMKFDGTVITSKVSHKLTRNEMDMYMDYSKREISLWLQDGDETEVKRVAESNWTR